MSSPVVSVVIPSWNGLELLRRHLPSALEAAREAGGEVVVCDDGSTDGTPEALAREFPDARVARRDSNGGFSLAANAGIAAASAPVVVLANSDVDLQRGSIPVLVEALERDPRIFAAAPSLLRTATGVDEARTRIRFRRGIVSTALDETPGEAPHYACGGAAAFRRDDLLGLGGFDRTFAPFYWEDVDLSYRARRRGGRVELVESARALHDHGATIGPRFARDRVATIYERNRLLFTWKNLVEPRLFRAHLAVLPLKVAWDLVAYPEFVRGLREALALRHTVLAARRAERAASGLADSALLGS